LEKENRDDYCRENRNLKGHDIGAEHGGMTMKKIPSSLMERKKSEEGPRDAVIWNHSRR